MSSASKELRRARDVAALFDEAQGLGTGWLEGVRVFRRRAQVSAKPRRERSHVLSHRVRRERAQAVLKSLLEGASAHDAAARFGLSVASVKRYAALAGVPCPRRMPRAEARRRAVLAELRSGATYEAAARRADVCAGRAYQIARAARFRKQAPRDPGRDRAIADLALSGATIHELARRFGLSPSGISHALRRQGVRLGLKGRAGPKAPKGRRKAIVEALRAGLSHLAAARALGLPPRTLEYHVDRAIAEGLLPPRRRRAA